MVLIIYAKIRFFYQKCIIIEKKVVLLHPHSKAKRSVSSVGLERLLDRQEVTSSNLVQITKKKHLPADREVFCFTTQLSY